MSSKAAGARAGKELTIQLLSLLTQRKLLNDEEMAALFPHDPYYRRRWHEMKRLKYVTQRQKKYAVTARGRKHLKRRLASEVRITPQKQWDGKWRLVLFDIPQSKKKGRDSLRAHIKAMGLVRYQDSVWVHPYPLRNAIGVLAHHFGVAQYISFAVAEHLTGEAALERIFGV